MFIFKTLEKNKPLIDFAIKMHKQNLIVPNTYVIDFDSVIMNAKKMLARAKEFKIDLFYMAKQYGRIPTIGYELEKLGFQGAVVVDHQGLETAIKNNLKVANVGHLSQVPNAYIDMVIDYDVTFVTFYSFEKMQIFNEHAKIKNKIIQAIIKVIDAKNDVIYNSQESGFSLKEIASNILKFQSYENIKIVGLTSFPCFVRDDVKNTEAPTNNLSTLQKAQKIFANHQIKVFLNTPSSTSYKTLEIIHKFGGNQGEPGHALTGTVRSTAYNEQFCEIPAMIYVSEISHNFNNKAYAFAGGNYSRGGIQNALIGSNTFKPTICQVFPIEPKTIDYYFELNQNVLVGETVIMAFRAQVFTSRSKIALIKGLSTSHPFIQGIYDNLGNQINE